MKNMIDQCAYIYKGYNADNVLTLLKMRLEMLERNK